MARGFESKNIEYQQEEAARGRLIKEKLSAEEQARIARRGSVELARKRAVADLARATAPAHKTMLEQAIEALDAQLREI